MIIVLAPGQRELFQNLSTLSENRFQTLLATLENQGILHQLKLVGQMGLGDAAEMAFGREDYTFDWKESFDPEIIKLVMTEVERRDKAIE